MSDGHIAEKPVYHVAPKEGWVNDPNGPFMYQGKYHLFYQHLPHGCEWAFGLVWGHSVSTDLIHWQHLPHAMVPTPGSLDADGCFSGCATVDTDGTPVLLYTGVRLRTNPDAQPPPPPECDLHLPFIESQLYAVPRDPDGDPHLIHWVKEPSPFIGLPPPNMNLTGWRDPFVVERPCEANGWEWIVLMGSGIKEVGGATIVYRTRHLRDASSWRYDGLLCTGDGATGAVWECPLLAELNPMPAGGVPLGSCAHDRVALGTRRSYTQLHSAGSGSSSNIITLGGVVSGGSGGGGGGGEQQQQEQQEKQQQQLGRPPADKQQQQPPQHADKQAQQQQQDGPSQNSSDNSTSTSSSNTLAGAAAAAPPDDVGRDDVVSFPSKQQQIDQAGNTANTTTTTTTSTSNTISWPGPLSQGAPYAVCQSGARYPAFVAACSSSGGSGGGQQQQQQQWGQFDERYTHFYSISPDACTNPTIYWLGRYAHGRFDLDAAKGPFRLDLGDTLYAPNVMRDDSGRVVLWGWLQEKRTVGTYDYAGCMTVPRLLHLDNDRLHQSPAPELLSLRRGESWQCGHVTLGPESTLAVPGVVGSNFLDIEAVFSQGSASTVGIFLRSWNQSGEGGAAVLFNWETALLEVVFEALDPTTMSFSLTAPLARRIGGNITHKPGAPLALRLLLDGSCLEIFTGSGEVLSTRIYRGASPHGHTDAGIEFVALDGEATLERVAAYDMASIWLPSTAAAAAAAAASVEEAAQTAAAAAAAEGLDLEGLDFSQLNLNDLLSNATLQEQQQVEKALSLSQSLGSRALSPTALSVSSSLRENLGGGSMVGMFGPLSPALSSNKLHQQQLLLSPTASSVLLQGAAAAAAAAGGGAGGGVLGSQSAAAAAAAMAAAYGGGGGYDGGLHDLPLEEEMTADIFNLE